eukprot:TRINITY_DN24624_c0_g1_i1.p1 TRINITY_DN24624_c0_g1~~TRINITY_DN24624_c0_g1_i1.p1  ORF type:complete len:320 (+),score=7.47 TRINITY_DN24624_c0_g1_i1:87-1046(+)
MTVKLKDDCCICLANESDVLLFPCYHPFCEVCITKWFQEKDDTVCPLCKGWATAKIKNIRASSEFVMVNLLTNEVLHDSGRHIGSRRHALYQHRLCVQYSPSVHTVKFPACKQKGVFGEFGIETGTSADWWRKHKTQQREQRLSEWITRDVEIILNVPDVTLVVGCIAGIVDKAPILGYKSVQCAIDLLGELAPLFMYELYMYLRSDMMSLQQYDTITTLHPCPYPPLQTERPKEPENSTPTNTSNTTTTSADQRSGDSTEPIVVPKRSTFISRGGKKITLTRVQKRPASASPGQSREKRKALGTEGLCGPQYKVPVAQ